MLVEYVWDWLGMEIVLPGDIATLLEIFASLIRNKKGMKGLMLIWHSTIWLIWKTRNDKKKKKTSCIQCRGGCRRNQTSFLKVIFGEEFELPLLFLWMVLFSYSLLGRMIWLCLLLLFFCSFEFPLGG